MEKIVNKTDFLLINPINSSGLLQENTRLSSELSVLRGKIKNYEEIERKLEDFQQENLLLKEQKESQFNDILKEFDLNFRKKIVEIEKEKDFYKEKNKEILYEKNAEKLEKEEKIYELEYKIKELKEILKEKEEKEENSKGNMKNSGNYEEILEKFKDFTEENKRISMELHEKKLEIEVWKEKFYEKTGENSVFCENSMKIQIKELKDKAEIFNRIIEENTQKNENLEMELKIYKQKNGDLLRRNEENEKKILNLIKEFEKLSQFCGKIEGENRELQRNIDGSNRNSRSFNGKNSEVLSEKNKENERVFFPFDFSEKF